MVTGREEESNGAGGGVGDAAPSSEVVGELLGAHRGSSQRVHNADLVESNVGKWAEHSLRDEFQLLQK